jgi:hypothetical protein
MFAPVERKLTLVRQYGIRRCLFRFTHDLKRKSGLLKRRFPAYQWEDQPLTSWLKADIPSNSEEFRRYHESHGGQFFFVPGEPVCPPKNWANGALEEVEALRQGRIQYFSILEGQIGFPKVDWFLNPFTGQRDSAEKHWCDRSDFSADRGDIKYIWEPSRFGWAYALVRAYGIDRCDEYAESFWLTFEDWLKANPPQMGPNWQCGQEIAIRVMACIFAMYAFGKSPATTAGRISSMVSFLACSAERIAGNINYARVQMGNHATTEAAGLYTIGVLLPELSGAERFRKLGRFVLEDEAHQNNWLDGSYTQHSMNYQRLMLHDYLWSLRLAELNGETFSRRLNERIEKSYKFLYQLQDAATGWLPNYGPNDGADIVPLNSCHYLDYRPIIGSMHYLFHHELLYDDGPWLEDLLWLFGPKALESDAGALERVSSDFLTGGYFTLRGRQSWAMTRCHTFRNRPNQADMLHFDLWWRGVNILHDVGSFTYFDPIEKWHKYFISTAAHNTVVVGGVNQMIKGPRFQWFSLVKSRFIRRDVHQHWELWQGEHYGYSRLASRATHRRTICRIGSALWFVVDDILGHGREKIQLFWHLADGSCKLDGHTVRLQVNQANMGLSVFSNATDIVYRLERGLEGKERMGWQSLHYGKRLPSPTMCVETYGGLPLRFVTVISLGHMAEVKVSGVEKGVAWSGWPNMPTGRLTLAPINWDNKVVREIALEDVS